MGFSATWRARLDAFPQSLLQLFMRFSIFWVFWRSGALKALTIQFLVYWNDYPSHLLWVAILVFILVRGPGPWSLDALLFKKLK